MILRQPDDVRPYLERVVSAADDHRDELGFFPQSVYAESAERGRLWVAVDPRTREAAGFLRFGGSDRQLRVFQIFAFRTAQGVGQRLLSELVRHGEERSALSITARVAADLDANRFWKNAGFRIHRREPGGKTTKRIINVYLRDLDVPSLLRGASAVDDAHPSTAEGITFHNRPRLRVDRWVLDLNVVFDALVPRDEGQALSLLAANPIVVTTELIRELERTSSGEDDRLLRSARVLPRLPEPPADSIAQLTKSLRETLELAADATSKRGITDTSDLHHLATCIYHRAHGFVTRDGRILRHAEDLQSRFGLRVAAPADLVPPALEDPEPGATPVNVELDHGHLSGGMLGDDDHDDLTQALERVGSSHGRLRAFLDPGTTQQPTERRVVRVDGQIVGVGALAPPPIDGEPWTAHVHVEEDRAESLVVAENLFEWLLKPRTHNRLYRIDLHSGPGQLAAKQVAFDCGFRRVEPSEDGPRGQLSKLVFGGVLRPEQWQTFAADFEEHSGLRLEASMPSWDDLTRHGIEITPESGPKKRIQLFDFETLIGPGLLLPVDRPGVVVPIRPEYAAQLLPPTVKQTSFLPEREAALRLERAYFFRAGRHDLVSRGKIVVFYISSPRKEAAAVARVTFSATLSKDDAAAALGRQGVLSPDDITARANDSGQVTAFTFDGLCGITDPIPLRKLKRLGCASPTNYVEAEALSHDQLRKIIHAGFGEPDS